MGAEWSSFHVCVITHYWPQLQEHSDSLEKIESVMSIWMHFLSSIYIRKYNCALKKKDLQHYLNSCSLTSYWSQSIENMVSFLQILN